MSTQPRLPEGLRDITKSLTKEILREKPRDIYGFAAGYFESQLPRSERYSVSGYEPGQDYATLLKASSRHTQLPITLVYAIMPDRLIEFIKDFIKAVLKQSPANICHFAVQYFRHMQKERPMEMTPQDYEEYERYLKSKGRYAYPIKCMCGRWLGRATTEDVAANCQGIAKKQVTEKTLNGQREEGFDEKSKELRGNYVKVKEVHEKIHVLKQMKALKAIDNDGKDEDTAQDESPSSKDVQGVSKEVNGFPKGDMQSTNDKSLTSKGFNSSSKAYVYPSKNKTSLIMDSLPKDENSTSNKEETKLTPTKDEINSTIESVYTSNEVKDPSKDEKYTSNNEKDPSNSEKDTPKNEKEPSNDDKDAQNNEKDSPNSEKDPSKDEKDPSKDVTAALKDDRDPSKDEKDTSQHEKDPSNEEKASSNDSKMPTSAEKEPKNTKNKIGALKDDIDPSKDEQIPSIDKEEPSKDELNSSETEKVPSNEKSSIENVSKDETGQTSELTPSQKAASPSPTALPTTTYSPNEQYLNAVHVIQRFIRKSLRRKKSHFTATPPTNRLTDEMAALIIQRSVRRLFAAKQTKSIGGDHTPMQPITDSPSLIDEQSDISEATSYTSAASTVVAGQGEDKDTPAARDINDDSDLLESMLLNAFNNQEELADERPKRSLEEVQGDERDLKEVPKDKTDELLGNAEPSTEGVDEKEQQKGQTRGDSMVNKSAEASLEETKDTKESVSLTEKEPAATTTEKEESEENKESTSPSENTERDEPPTPKASETNQIVVTQPDDDKDGITSLNEEKEEIEKSLKVDNELPKSLEKDKNEDNSEKIELKEPLEIDDKNAQQSAPPIDGQEGDDDEHLKEPAADETAANSPSAKQTAARDTPKSADPSTSAIPSASEKIATDSESAHANGGGEQGETMENTNNDAPEIIVKNLVRNVSGERAISKMPEMEEGVKEQDERRADATGNDNNDKAIEENAKLQAEDELEEAKKLDDLEESQLKATRERENEDLKGPQNLEKDQKDTEANDVNKAVDLKELEGCKDDAKSKDGSSIEESAKDVNEDPKKTLDVKDELNSKETTSNILPNDDKVIIECGEEPSTDGLNSKMMASSAGIMAAVVATQVFGMESAAKGSETKAQDPMEDLNIKAAKSDVDVADKPIESKETKLDSDGPSKLAADEEDKKIFEILRAATMDDEVGRQQAEELAKEILDSVAEKINEMEKIVPERVADQPRDEDIDDPKKEDEPPTEEPGKGTENPSEVEALIIQEEPLATTQAEEEPSNKSSTEADLKTVTKQTNDSKDTPADDSVNDDLSSQEVSLAGIKAATVAAQAFGIETDEKDAGTKAAIEGDSDKESSKISLTKGDKNIDSKETTENKEDPLEEPKDKQAVVEDIIEKSICSVLTEDDTLLDALADEINGTEDSKISTEKEIVKTIKASEEGDADDKGGDDIDKTLKAANDSNVKENANILKDKRPDNIKNEDGGNGEQSQTNLDEGLTKVSPIKDETGDQVPSVNGTDVAEELPSNASFINLRQIVDEAIELDKETERENGKNKEKAEAGGKANINKEQDETNDSKDYEDSKSDEELKQKDQSEEENAKTVQVQASKSLSSTEIPDVKSSTEKQSVDAPSDKEKSETGKASEKETPQEKTPQKEAPTEVSSSEIEDSKQPSWQAKNTEEETTKMKRSLSTSATLKKDEENENLEITVGSKDEPQNNKEDIIKPDNEKGSEESVESPVSLGEKARKGIDNREADESSINIQVAEKLSIVDEQLKGADMDEENNNDLRFNKNIAMLTSKEKDDEKSNEMDTKNAESKDNAEAKEANEKDTKVPDQKSENYLFPLRAALETKDTKDSKGNEIGRQQQQQTSTTTLPTTPTTIGTQNSPNSSSKVASSNEKSKIVATQQPSPPPTQPQPTTSLSNKLSKTHPLPSNSGSNSNLSSTGSSIVDQKIYTDKYMGLPIAEIHLKSFKAVNALEAFPWFDESKSPLPSNSDDKAEKNKEVSEAGVQVDSREVAGVAIESLKGKEAREEATKEVLERSEEKPNLKLDLRQSNQHGEIVESMEKISYSKEVTSEASASTASLKESSSQTSEDVSSKASDSPSVVPETERTATYLYGIHPAEQKKVYKPPTAFVIPFDTKRKGKGSKPKIGVPQDPPIDPTKSSEEEREDSIDLESPTKLFAELSAFDDELENDSDDLVQYSLNETRRLGDHPPATSDSSLSDMEETDGYVEGDNNDNASHLSIIMEVSECDDSPSPKANDTSSTYDADYWEQLYMKHGKQDRNLHESGKVYNNALEHMRNESDDSLQVPSAQGRVKRSYFEKVANIPEIVKASTTIQRAYRGYAERKKKRTEVEGGQEEMTTSKEKEATESEATSDLKETKKEIESSQSMLSAPVSPKNKSSPSNNKEDPPFDPTSRMSAEDLLQMSQASKKPQPSQTFFGNPQTMDDLKHFIEACIRIQRFYRRYVKKRPAPVNSGTDQTSVVRKASNVKPEDLRDFVEASIKIQRFFRRHVKSRQNKVVATETPASKSVSDDTRKTEESETKEEESTQKLKSVIEASITIQRFYRHHLLRKNRAAPRNMKDKQIGEGGGEETPQEKRVDVVSLMADLPSIPSNNPSEDDDTSCSESLKSIDDTQLTDLTGACVKIQRFYRKHLNEKREIEARKRSGKSIDPINEETNNEAMKESSNLNNNSMDIQDLEQMSEACILIQRFYRRYRKDKKQGRPLTSDSMASDVVIVPGNLDSQELAKLSEACVKIQKFYRQHLKAKRELEAEKETTEAKTASNSDTTLPNPDKSIRAPNTKDMHDLEDISDACVTIQRYYRRYVNKKREKQQRPLTSDSAASDVVVVPGNLDSQELAKLSEACVKIQKFYRQHLQAKREQKALQKSAGDDELAKEDYKALETSVKSSEALTKLSKSELDKTKVNLNDLNSKDVHDLKDLSEACITIQRFYRQYRTKKLRKQLKRERPVTSDSVASDIVIVPGNLDTQDMSKLTEACVKIQRFYRQYKERESSQGEKTPERNSLQGRSRKKSTEEVVIKKSSPKNAPRDIQEQLEELTRASIAIQRFYRRYAKRKLTAQRPGTVDSLANDVIIQPYAGDINDLARLTEACVKIQRFYREYAQSNNTAPTSSGAEFIEPHNSPGAMDDAQQFADASVKIQRFYRRRLQSKNAGKLLAKETQQQQRAPQQPEIITPTSTAVTSANKAAAPSIALPIATAADDVKAIDKFEALSRTPGSASSHGLRRSLAESSFINKRPESGRNDLQHLIEACITIQRFYRRYAATAKRRAGQKEKFQNAARIIQRRFRAYKAGKGLTAPPLGEGDNPKEGEKGLRKITSGHMETVAASIIQNAYREYLQRRRRLTSEAAAGRTEQLALNGKPPHAPFGSNDNGSIAAVTPDTSTNTPTTTTTTLTSKVNWFVGNDPIVPTATTTPNENESLIAVVDPLNGSSSSSSTNLIDSACEEAATVKSPTPQQSETVDSPTKRIPLGNTLNNATDVTLEKQGTGLASAEEGEKQREEDAKGEAEITTEQVKSVTEALSDAEHVNGETEAGTERVKRETGELKDEDSNLIPTCMGLSEFLSEFLQKERENALPQPPSQTNPDSENVSRLVVPSLAVPLDTPIPYEKMAPVNLESNDSLSSTSLDGSTTDLEDSSLDTITEKLQMQQDETIDRMAKRRASQPKIEVALEQLKAATHFEEPQIKALTDNDEEDGQVVMQPLQPEEETRQSTADSATVVMGPHADEIGENFTTEPVFKGAFKRLHTIAGGDERSLFKSVTIDETPQYIEPSSGGTSGSSFCLDDDTTAEIRHKMLAYSISEGDSDYMGVRSSVMGVSTDERLPSLGLDDFNITTALGDTVGTSTDTESTIVSAATKIQAGARGFLARRRLQRFSGGTKSSFQTDHKASFGNAAIDESLERLVEDVAAKKIQTAYRKHYRKNLKQRQADAGQSMESSLAAKRMTLQRGDALRNYSTPDEETDASESGVGAKAKEVSLKEPPKKGKSAVSPRDRSVPRWPTRRQYSMPVQIESEIFRVIPKHRRKRIRSAEAEKK